MIHHMRIIMASYAQGVAQEVRDGRIGLWIAWGRRSPPWAIMPWARFGGWQLAVHQCHQPGPGGHWIHPHPRRPLLSPASQCAMAC
jgi:hypothetical protein